MKQNNESFLRGILEQMTTEQLDVMLHDELRKEPANGQAVRMILKVLKEREANYPIDVTPEVNEAWERYKTSTSEHLQRPAWNGSRLLKVASIVVVIFILIFALPQTAEAESFWGRLVRWTDSFFELFDLGEKNDTEEFVFTTDHPGLQQLYDTVTELGVTDPVVPMWLPDGYELLECKVKDTPMKKGVYAHFSDNKNTIIIAVDINYENISKKYNKDKTTVKTLELDGTIHNIMKNNEEWIVIWTRDNLDCTITTDCQEDALYEILRSIYRMEV